MQDSLLSLHIMTLWLLVTLPRSYNQGKNITCKFFKECLAKHVSPSIYPRLHRISTDIKFCYICMVSQISPHWMQSDTMHMYTYHGENVCQRLLQTNHTIPQLVLQLVGHLPHQPPLLKLVSCKCKTGCSQGCGCHYAPNSSESFALL